MQNRDDFRKCVLFFLRSPKSTCFGPGQPFCSRNSMYHMHVYRLHYTLYTYRLHHHHHLLQTTWCGSVLLLVLSNFPLFIIWCQTLEAFRCSLFMFAASSNSVISSFNTFSFFISLFCRLNMLHCLNDLRNIISTTWIFLTFSTAMASWYPS